LMISIKFYKETNFKETPIGKIPKDWEITTLENICTKVKAGGTPRTSKKEYWNGNLPFVKIEDITSSSKYLTVTKNLISKDGLSNSSAWIVPENSLLLAMYGSLGEVAINKIPVTTNQAILGIVPRDREDVEFLYYWYSFFKPVWKKYAKPTTQANLTAEIVRNSVVSFPPKKERRMIVKVLSCVDLAIQKVDEAIARAERLKKGLMQQLLTKGIGHKEFKETPIGKIPKTWKVVRVNEVCNSIKKGIFDLSPINYVERGIPFLRISDIVDDEIDLSNTVFIPEEIHKKEWKTELTPGDLILSKVGTLNKIAVIPPTIKRCNISQNLIGIKVDRNKINSHFLLYILKLDKFAKRILISSNITTLGAIRLDAVKKLPIPLPPYTEQGKIVEILSSVDNILRLKKEKKEKLVRMKKRLMDLLLTGRVRVSV